MASIWRSETRGAQQRRLTSVVVFLIAALLLVVAACGGDDDAAAPAPAPTVEPEAPAEEPAPDPEPALEEEPAEEAAPRGNPDPTTNAVQRIDTETGALAATVELQRTADGIAATDEDVYVFDKSGQALLPVDTDTNAIGEPIPLDAVAADGRVDGVTGRADSLFVTGGGPCDERRCPVKSYDPQSGSITVLQHIETEESSQPNNDPPVDAFGDVWFLDSPLLGTEGASATTSTLVRYVDGNVSPTAAIPLSTEEFPVAGRSIFAVDERSLWVMTAFERPPGPDTSAAVEERTASMALWSIDPETNEVAGAVEIPIALTRNVTIAVGAGSLWIPDRDDDAVLQIDQSSGAIQNEIRVGSQPLGAVFANGGVWVANGQDGTVSRIDPDTLDVTTTTVGGTPTGIVTTEDAVWVTVRP